MIEIDKSNETDSRESEKMKNTTKYSAFLLLIM